jgi:hypothetical protein
LDAYISLVEAGNHSASIRSFVAVLRSEQDMKLSVIQRAAAMHESLAAEYPRQTGECFPA